MKDYHETVKDLENQAIIEIEMRRKTNFKNEYMRQYLMVQGYAKQLADQRSKLHGLKNIFKDDLDSFTYDPERNRDNRMSPNAGY